MLKELQKPFLPLLTVSKKPFPHLFISKAMKFLHEFTEKAWLAGTVSDEWKLAESIFEPNEKDSRDLKQFRPILWLNEDIFCHYGPKPHVMMANQYVNASVQKGDVPGVLGFVEHTTTIWEAIQRAKRNRLSMYVVWLDLANAYGSVPRQLIWRALETNRVPKPMIYGSYPSELLWRFRNEVHHQELHDKMGPTIGWHCHGMRHLARPLRIGDPGHS